MPPEDTSQSKVIPRGSRCPLGRDCPWDLPYNAPPSIRWYWAWRAFLFALTGQHPIVPIVLQPEITPYELRVSDTLTPYINGLIREIEQYEEELAAFQTGENEVKHPIPQRPAHRGSHGHEHPGR